MVNFELRRLVSTDKDSIIAEIQRVAELIDTHIISYEAFNKYSKVSYSTVLKRFGNWKEALNQSGLGHRYSGSPVSKKKLKEFRSYTDDQMILELRSIAQKLGVSTYTMEQFNKYSSIHPETIRRRFGSWWSAMNQAGLVISNRGKRYSDDDYFENLLTVWTHYGRQPTYGEMDRAPSKISAKAYEAKWRTWKKALIAFIDRVNSDTEKTDITGAQVESDKSKKHQKPPGGFRRSTQHRVEEKRSISIGLRYDVLSRDRFRCVVCGVSPASDLGCQLHVDHIIPFSKGGKTVSENLRTLCSKCNIGKSNK